MDEERKKALLLKLQKKIKLIELNEKNKKEWSGKQYKNFHLYCNKVKNNQYWYAQKKLSTKKAIYVYIGKVDTLQDMQNKIDTFFLKNKNFLEKKMREAINRKKQEQETNKAKKNIQKKEEKEEIGKYVNYWKTNNYKEYNIVLKTSKKNRQYFFAHKKGVSIYIGTKPTYTKIFNKINKFLGEDKNGVTT